MIKEYVEAHKPKIYGFQWFPDKPLPDHPSFKPNIVFRNDRYWLEENGYMIPLEPGYYISYSSDVLGYEAWTEKGFFMEFVEAPADSSK